MKKLNEDHGLDVTPLLIHQMGRVGSTSIYNAVKNIKQYRAYHTHILNVEKLRNFVRSRREKNLKIPNHVNDSFEVLATIIGHEPHIKIISLVRDPMARNVSAFFNNLDTFGFRSKVSRQEAQADELLRRFNAYDHDIPAKWFSDEFRDVFGFTIYNQPFDHVHKRLWIRKDNVSLLVLRVEDSEDVKKEALEKFLETSNISLEADNVGSGKFGPAYQEFKHLFRPDDALLNRIYKSRLANHFYTPEELESMREKWLVTA